MTVRLLGQDVALSRQKDGFKSHTVHYYGGSSMVEHLTENQKKRVRFSPFTIIINKIKGRVAEWLMRHS